MSTEPKSEVWNLIAVILGRYGKIGLLIDDAIDARIRVARELYGAEGLPDWWIQVQSVECGFLALQDFLDWFPPSKIPPYRGIVIVDRFLPVRDQGRPTAWDAPRLGTSPEDRRICADMEQVVRRTLALAEDSDRNCCFCKVITSYPHSSLEDAGEAVQAPPVPWQTRSIEVLYQFRRRLVGTSLLSFGPDRNALFIQATAVPPYIEPPELEAAKWKAQYWRESLHGLAEALAHPRKDRPIVLFTGAGASLADGIHGPGMPTTSRLLEETCEIVGKVPEREDPEGEPKGCWHGMISKKGKRDEPKPFPKDPAPIDFLIQYLSEDRRRRASDLECRLEILFSKRLNKASTLNGGAERFYDCFRDILQRSDHGFRYHHWLLAQMPWTRIVTTNFDSFHERAAMAAATTFPPNSAKRLDCLRLANVFPISALESRGASLTDQQVAELYRTCLLFKPYGSLLSPVELAVGAEDIDKFSIHLERALDVIKKAKEGWLVVIGHAMRDAYIEKVLNELDGPKQKLQRRFELFWVDPVSFERCRNPIPRGDQTIGFAWDRLVDGKRSWRGTEQAEGFAARYSGPFPATALEFSYDLFIEYNEALRRLRPGGGA